MRALAAIHDLGILHAKFSPSHFFSRKGHPTVISFGRVVRHQCEYNLDGLYDEFERSSSHQCHELHYLGSNLGILRKGLCYDVQVLVQILTINWRS